MKLKTTLLAAAVTAIVVMAPPPAMADSSLVGKKTSVSVAGLNMTVTLKRGRTFTAVDYQYGASESGTWTPRGEWVYLDPHNSNMPQIRVRKKNLK